MFRTVEVSNPSISFIECDGDNMGETPSGGDGAAARETEPGAATVPISAEEIGVSLGEGPVAMVEGGGDGGAAVTPMDSAETIEGFVMSPVSDSTSKGGTVEVVEVSTSGGDTVMGVHRTVEESIGGGSINLAASVPMTPASTPFTPVGSVIEMEIGGLDVSVERRAMEERGTLASATPHEFPFTPSDTPIETESKGAKDEDAEAVAQRLARGKSIVGESDGQETRDPLTVPLFRPPIGSSKEQGVSLRDTLECADPRDLSDQLAKAPSLASALASEETF
ncbi:hypothetical protein RHSIM_Rhsim10G0124400 [Rhododendron simsii]|uniref:Uncharacterized protein n=1 Tax=Rhododendron simsii TaxID=118357 RepID=A0A834GBW2_RHOSS|nr:hypothetical protein RHSIM_Rhsim10G0124400 [Rhododendron simsii]